MKNSKKCNLCGTELDTEDSTTRNCGGDCLKCMSEIAEDPDCIREMKNITTPTPEISVEEMLKEHSFRTMRGQEGLGVVNEYPVVAITVQAAHKLIQTERQKREEMVKEAYKAGKQSFLKDIRTIHPKNIGKKTSYIMFDEVGEIDWDKLQALTQPNNK